MEVRYVYDNTEVVKTGRIARKQARKAVKRSERSPTRNDDLLYEVTPANEDDGGWKKWVKQMDLYEIVNEQDNRGIEEEDISS